MNAPFDLLLGRKTFDGTIPAAFKVTESTVGSSGVIVVNYERAGAIANARCGGRSCAGSRTVNLRTSDEAVELLGRMLWKWISAGTIYVRKARLGYAELGIEQKQRYLEPCYAFLLETAGGMVDSKRVEVIPAAMTGPMATEFAARL